VRGETWGFFVVDSLKHELHLSLGGFVATVAEQRE
jgi:hypothetical protein